ncbi:MAG: hypothetical protein AAF604_19885 [Acidobacteriota bacterium]
MTSTRCSSRRTFRQARMVFAATALVMVTAQPAPAASCPSDAELRTLCPRVVNADIVALDQPFFYNRLGASQPDGQIFALRSDVVCVPGTKCSEDELQPGRVMLRPDKRPRPMVLRVPEGDCLRIELENLLAKVPNTSSNERQFNQAYGLQPVLDQTVTRQAGAHVLGLSLVAACDGDDQVAAINADASFVGANDTSLANPGERRVYIYRAEQDGAYPLHSTAANAGLISGNGQIALGLHGMVNVEPQGSVFFRSQVTRQDLLAANRRADCPFPPTATADGELCLTPGGQPIIDYWAEDAEGRPILAMIDRDGNLTGTDLTAIVAYQDPTSSQPGDFPYDPDNPLCFPVPAATGNGAPEGRCTRPFREITALYQEPLAAASQTFPCITGTNVEVGVEGTWSSDREGLTTITLPEADCDDSTGTSCEVGVVTASQTTCPTAWNITPYLADIFSARGSLDSFAINYGMDAIGPRLLANRVRVGPQADCVGCKYEEFFLSSWPNGDPAQVSTQPAALGTDSANSVAATEAEGGPAIRFPDDPSNVYHSYLGDPVKYRIASVGGAAAHVHHQHAHQWLHTPNAAASHYLDSQTITPGSAYTLEMVYNGSGNRNETVGDAIFHCHFYPHFASGMWAMWRVHDVFEAGTRMDPESGRPASAWQCVHQGQTLAADDCRQLEGEVAWRLVEPNRALPDPTIPDGTPIPAIVPLPGLAMAPMPAPVALSPDGKRGLTLLRQGEGWDILGNDPALVELAGTIGAQARQPEINAGSAAEIGNPGFPFFIPGLAGQRAVRPPLDVAQHEQDGTTVPLDGGLPRHRIGSESQVAEVTDPADIDGCTPGAAGNSFRECHTRHDFSKILLDIQAEALDEQGEAAEKLAMLWHGELFPGGRVPSCDSSGTCDPSTAFRLNGSPPAPGAPYAEPCAREDQWNGEVRHYKAAAIQTDVVFTKEGWHFPQQRMLSLWQDVEPTLAGEKAPEPLFMRANSGECIDLWHANLVPSEYALDDYQVRTPTDIIGQHIHLVKFDVTSSDGAANGFNYEDATFSPDEVRERIAAINAGGGLRVGPKGLCPDGRTAGEDGRCPLEARPLPFFGPGPGGRWIGAMATVQRWMADPLEDTFGDDRTLRTVFTHDHLSPSTHQQAGLYAGVLIEPQCSQWVDSWTGEVMGGSLDPLGEECEQAYAARPLDGGPTSWRANILYRDEAIGGDSQPRLAGVREFTLEFQDMTLAYPANAVSTPNPLALDEICPTCPGPVLGSGIGPSSLANKFNYGVDYPRALNSPGINAPVGPWPQTVSFGAMFGAYSINYRSEPLAPRVTGIDGAPPPATGERSAARDYAQAYRSIERQNPALNVQPDWYPPLTGGAEGQDPMTPLLEAYAGDRLQIRTLTGAHFLNHQFTLRGLPWLFEPSLANSGYRAAQSTSLSEHFEINVRLPAAQGAPRVDYLYQTDSNVQAQGKGGWGLLRSYGERQEFLAPLPDNPPPERHRPTAIDTAGRWVCSPDSLAERDGFRTRRYRVLALDAESFAAGTALPYRSPVDLEIKITQADDSTVSDSLRTALESPNGVVYVLAEDVVKTSEGWQFREGRQHEPLVLRAAAGDCLEVTLENHLDPQAAAFVTDNPTDQPLVNPLQGSPECTDAGYRERLLAVQSGSDPTALDGFGKLCAGSFAASTRIGLHPQLVTYDPLVGAGYDAGINPVQTVPARRTHDDEGPVPTSTSYWFAGHVETHDEHGGLAREYKPVEFGAANLLSADPLFQTSKGLFGGLIIEPVGSRWVEDANTRLQATIYPAQGPPYREGVLFFQDDLELYFRDQNHRYQALNVLNVGNFSGQVAAVGYGIETPLLRMAPPAAQDLTTTAPAAPGDTEPQPYGSLLLSDFAHQQCWLSSAQVKRDPSTTLLTAHAGTPYRLRLLHPLGNFTGQTFVLHGHGWQEEPYVPLPGRDNVAGYAGPGPVPQTLGDNPFSQWFGSQGGFGSGEHFDVVLAPVGTGTGRARHNGAGGQDRVPGDYLYRSWQSNGFTGGAWGLFRVGPEVAANEHRDIVTVLSAVTADTTDGALTTVIGSNSSILGSQPGERRFASRLSLYAGSDCSGEPLATLDLEAPTGPTRTWSWTGDLGDSTAVCVASDAGGRDTAEVTTAIPCPAIQTASAQEASQ